MSAELLKDLAKAKAVFQQRTIKEILEQRPIDNKEPTNDR